ncbi:MAG: site-specific DNA-methyltransferase [Actinobacteria bacterium ATB1]|nr:site-specific DNA-methyltransferase [Actinobacteria bacterium ATB1]
MSAESRARRNVRRRGPTSTSAFGVGRRESHDASDFYARFVAPEISDDDEVTEPVIVDEIWDQDARTMTTDQVADNSVALVVTSPPYFAGKEYETALGEGHVPASYLEYLQMLEEVFAVCAAKLEPGGRMCVNVANLGRKPYRSLSADVIDILERRLRLLLRGEVIWQKARGATGSCAWGSFQSPQNPVLRDLTERIVIASKGRFDRARTPRQRHADGLPSEASIWTDEFLDATTDVWEIPPESARRVNHPAPFPVELPQRLIDLYTYRGDLVMDPFMGSGSTAVAAVRTERYFVGFDTDPEYKKIADVRIQAERDRLAAERASGDEVPRVVIPANRTKRAEAPDDGDFQARAVREGRKARDLARYVLEACGFEVIAEKVKYPEVGVEVNFAAFDATGKKWHFDVSGAFTSTRPGLQRTDTLWKALGKAAALHTAHKSVPLVLLTTDVPPRGSSGDKALSELKGEGRPIFDVVELLNEDHLKRLKAYGSGNRRRP